MPFRFVAYTFVVSALWGAGYLSSDWIPVHGTASTDPAVTHDGRPSIRLESAGIGEWPLTLAEQTNVMLDIKPARGHRVLMQSYPGGIESGTDWYQNDAGVVRTDRPANC